MSENMHPYLSHREFIDPSTREGQAYWSRRRAIEEQRERDSFTWCVNDFDGLYEHLEDIITDVVTGDTDDACLKLRLLMCACTMAAERAN